MLSKNNYKRILSQLFDVKPMKNSVDLDWETIRTVDKILDLKNVFTGKEIHIRREALILNRRRNIHSLRENESVIFIQQNKNDYDKKMVKVGLPVDNDIPELNLNPAETSSLYSRVCEDDVVNQENRLFGEEANVYSQLLSDDYFAAIKSQGKQLSRVRLNEELPITQEDALREFERVDARDNIIEERYEAGEINDSMIGGENTVDFTENNRDGACDYFAVDQSIDSFTVEALDRSSLFIFWPLPLFSKIRFNGLVIALFAVISLFSAAFFWNKTNNSGELISASSYQGIVASVGETVAPFPVRPWADGERRYINDFNVLQGDISFGDFFSFLGKYGSEYLLIFQNSAEMRATGGAIEFYGILKIENGTPNDFSVGEILNLDAKLTENIIPPRPLQKISTGWSMHNANWFPDFPSSARKLSLFYTKITGETVDGVISFNSALIADILAVIGPVKIDNYGEEISADNISDFLAKKTDNLKFLLKEEKNLFPYFARLLINKISLLDETGQRKVFAVLTDSLNKRNIQLFFNDAEAENIISSNNWGGEMPAGIAYRQAGDKDFLSVINSSVDGYKNDSNIEETINHTAEIQTDGSMIDTVRILKNYKEKNLDNKLSNLMDYNYLRVFVPYGSELLEVEGLSKEDYYAPIDYEKNNFQRDVQVSEIEQSARFYESGAEVFQESGKTVFGGWVYVAPGHSVSIKYKYKLPFKALKGGDYSLTVRKQSGSIDSNFVGIIEPVGGFAVKDKSDNLREESGVYKISENLNGDLEYGVSFE